MDGTGEGSHNISKAAAWQTLRRTVQADGMTVEVDDSDYEFDAVVFCLQPANRQVVGDSRR